MPFPKQRENICSKMESIYQFRNDIKFFIQECPCIVYKCTPYVGVIMCRFDLSSLSVYVCMYVCIYVRTCMYVLYV